MSSVSSGHKSSVSSERKMEFSSKEFVGLVERNKSKLITISLSLLAASFAVSFILVALFPPAGAYGDPVVLPSPPLPPTSLSPQSMYMKSGMRAMVMNNRPEDPTPLTPPVLDVVACTHCAVPPGKLIGFSMIGPALAIVVIIALVAVFVVKKKKLEETVSGVGSSKRDKRSKASAKELELLGGFFGDLPDADYGN